MTTRRVIGAHVSPYARKVYLALATKGLDYECDPITPFFGNDAFARLSPLRRIPVLIDGALVVNDSTVICEYLDEAYPGAPLYPANPPDRARARWLEEYADSRLGDAIIWKLFFNRIIGPAVFKQPIDEARVAEAIERDLPEVMAWLEPQAPRNGFLFGDTPMVADFTFASFFRNAALARWTPDAWPATAAWLARVQALPVFAETIRIEQIMLTTRRADQREALLAAGVPLVAASVGGREARRGLMPI
ncbi:glutathione S-transferase family protein [Sphingomonas sp.]|uniref:glutathione S-transferase family protein n=1 Tax=Sphingomonas sp. TaxID=28214 RepID=UPI003CC5ABF9